MASLQCLLKLLIVKLISSRVLKIIFSIPWVSNLFDCLQCLNFWKKIYVKAQADDQSEEDYEYLYLHPTLASGCFSQAFRKFIGHYVECINYKNVNTFRVYALKEIVFEDWRIV